MTAEPSKYQPARPRADLDWALTQAQLRKARQSPPGLPQSSDRGEAASLPFEPPATNKRRTAGQPAPHDRARQKPKK